MNRRSFFKALAGLAASPWLAKLPVPVIHTTPKLSFELINIRELYRRELARWMAQRMDEMIFAAFTKGVTHADSSSNRVDDDSVLVRRAA